MVVNPFDNTLFRPALICLFGGWAEKSYCRTALAGMTGFPRVPLPFPRGKGRGDWGNYPAHGCRRQARKERSDTEPPLKAQQPHWLYALAGIAQNVHFVTEVKIFYAVEHLLLYVKKFLLQACNGHSSATTPNAQLCPLYKMHVLRDDCHLLGGRYFAFVFVAFALHPGWPATAKKGGKTFQRSGWFLPLLRLPALSIRWRSHSMAGVGAPEGRAARVGAEGKRRR